MIGTFGFLEELSFVLIPALLLLVILWAIRRAPKAGGGFSVKGLVVLLVAVLLPTFTTWKFVKQTRNHLFLSSLTSEKVLSLSIGTHQVTDPDGKFLVVQALRETQWFAPHHGGWAQPVDFRMRLSSGEERFFRVGIYRREHGAVIDFGPPDGAGGIHPGYAFSKTLPDVLKELGIELKP
jgi:hypothetical protein